MKIGEYVRTIYGIKKITDIICGQDIRFDNTDGFDEDLLKYHDYDGISKNSHTWEEIVIGEPKKEIIDLIEVGDYVNGYKARDINNVTGFVIVNTSSISENTIFSYNIKSIVTKEQFEQMEYKVNE